MPQRLGIDKILGNDHLSIFIGISQFNHTFLNDGDPCTVNVNGNNNTPIGRIDHKNIHSIDFSVTI
ncbi:hypothetical protein C9J44_10650 [Photobacterium sp. GB-27]|nr:hypothetical protein C9J42_02620 [Photobacterium sp. GB-56]PSV36403.1 hypothetical protein C9J44_10650 [Photobacterium sp. GB-27]